MAKARVLAVASSSAHGVRKQRQSEIRLVAGRGVESDAHFGELVQHRSRAARDPSLPNLRQVHLIHAELFEELRARGFDIAPGEMGENLTTEGVDLLALPTRTRLRLGSDAEVELTGLRNPCAQLDELAPGLMAATLDRDEAQELVRKAGVMAVVLASGAVAPGDAVEVHLPPGAAMPLAPV